MVCLKINYKKIEGKVQKREKKQRRVIERCATDHPIGHQVEICAAMPTHPDLSTAT
jgi:hypothetical protein